MEKRTVSARDTALEVLLALRHGAWSDEALDHAIEESGLDRRDAALCTQLCYGVLQTRAYLDYVIASVSSLKLNKIAPKVMEILRIAVYQLLFLDKIPGSAAVNEAVCEAKRFANPRAASFVNAVLRKIASAPAPEVPRTNDADFLATRYSHPKGLVELYLRHYGFDAAEALLKANNEPAPTVLRLNTLRGEPAALVETLKGQGMDLTVDDRLPTAAILDKAGRVTDYPGFAGGLFTVQDTASQLDALALDPQPGEEVLDLCAAPGGKSFAIAALMKNTGRIIACDIYDSKLAYIDEGARRLGATIIETAPIDATLAVPRFVDRFDRVLADVPCSGFGAIRKKPDIRYKDLREVAMLPRLQAEILHNASLYVKPAGVLVYSTCTIFPEENEEIIRAFLASHPEYAPEGFALPIIGACDGMRTLLPTTDGTDGFFIAKLRRANAENTEKTDG